MAYFTLENLTALIPGEFLTDGLDDTGSGTAEAFAKVQQLTEARVNGMLSARYATPITAGNAGADAFLLDACVHIAAAIVYTRRGIAPEHWPFKGEHSSIMARLRAIAKGDEPLVVAVNPERDAAVLLSEPARSHSSFLSA